MSLTIDQSAELVSVERGEIDRRIFSDPDIFELEMELIFGRAWLFLAHESQIPKSGDFFEAPMGKDNVLVVRQKDGSIKALLNTCTHRGNAVCRAEEGNTKNFMCTYHGWTFGLNGELIGVPGFENLYHSDLDKASLGLHEVAQLDTYKGFVFATMDPSAPPLLEYLGETGRIGLQFIALQGDMEVIPGIQKYVIDCNWKFAVDNLFDFYHAPITHMSSNASGVRPQDRRAGGGLDTSGDAIDQGGALKPDGEDLVVASGRTSNEAMVIIGEYGHAIGGPTIAAQRTAKRQIINHAWRDKPETKEALGPVGVLAGGHPSIFPTSWVTGGVQLCLRVPRSPNSTELWYFSFVDKNATPDERRDAVYRHVHVFGPAGLLEQEDGENWSQATRQTTGLVSKQIPQALKMDLGHGQVIKEHGVARIEGDISEHAQLWTYRAWEKWMSGSSWEQLRKDTEPVEAL